MLARIPYFANSLPTSPRVYFIYGWYGNNGSFVVSFSHLEILFFSCFHRTSILQSSETNVDEKIILFRWYFHIETPVIRSPSTYARIIRRQNNALIFCQICHQQNRYYEHVRNICRGLVDLQSISSLVKTRLRCRNSNPTILFSLVDTGVTPAAGCRKFSISFRQKF